MTLPIPEFFMIVYDTLFVRHWRTQKFLSNKYSPGRNPNGSRKKNKYLVVSEILPTRTDLMSGPVGRLLLAGICYEFCVVSTLAQI